MDAENRCWEWGSVSFGTVILWEHEDLDLEAQHSHKSGHAVRGCNTTTSRESRLEDPWGSLPNQTSQVSEVQGQ